jgi:kynurenine formamidase
MADTEEKRIVDLSHVIEHGMTTYKDLPGPHICDFWVREETADKYDDGVDLADLPLPSLADLPGIVIRRPWENSLAIEPSHLEGRDVAGRAVLVHTGWDRNWRTDAYFGDHPYLTAAAADWLAEHGAVLVGIDSCNIDNMHVRARPVHTKLLGANIPICEHMTGLGSLPDEGFRFSAVPPKVRGMGTFPVRAYAVLG